MNTDEKDQGPRFDASLPKLPETYGKNWRKTYRTDPADSPRMANYQAPGGTPIPFIQKGFSFTGGQSQDTAEYPFGGLWSVEYLNEKPQTLTVEGYLRGPTYIAQRNKLIEALRVPTDDDHPGYIDLPFWGRFPVIVGDHYNVSENADEQGQCAFSIPFTRAGVSITERLNEPAAKVQVEKAAEHLEEAATADFEANLTDDKLDKVTFASAFGQIKNALLGILGRIQGARTVLNAVTGEILGIMNLINQGICTPRELAQALFNAVASIMGGIQQIKNSTIYGREINTNTQSSSAVSNPTLPVPDNERNIAILFLSASTYSLSTETATVSQENTKKVIENLYRTVAFLAATQIIANMDSITYKNAGGYWRLLEKLEESINRENPHLYAALRDVRIALSRMLSGQELSREMSRRLSGASPLLYLAYYLGCDEDKIRELNTIVDSFILEGDVIYV
jgi:hypothetical protein